MNQLQHHATCGPWLVILAVVQLVCWGVPREATGDELSVAAAASGSALVPTPWAAGPHPVVVPPYRAQIRAAHRIHAEKTQLACVDCHAQAKTSARADDWLGPRSTACEQCHEIEHAGLTRDELALNERCKLCHLQSLGSRNLSHLHHSHQAHARRNIGCQKCHAGVTRLPDAAGSERLPTKALCVRCHAGRGIFDGQARAECTVCHESEGGRVRTRFQGQLLLPSHKTPSLEHGNDWLFRHGDVAGNAPNRCEGCHAIRECQACHDGRLRPRNIHPSDWLSVHALASKQEGPACQTCHRQQSFCLSCHQRLGLGSSGAAAAMGHRGAIHPPASVWVTGSVGPQHHATQARRNLTECVSCHQERDCVRCHATTTLGGGSPFGKSLNPHPPGFVVSCSSAWARNPRPCLSCHRPDGSELLRCQ